MYNPYYNMPYNSIGQKQDIIKVNGRNGAEMYQLSPNSSALLLDETAPIVWLVQTDGAGYKTLTGYDLKPHQDTQQQNLSALEERIANIERILKNEQSNTRNAKSKTSE